VGCLTEIFWAENSEIVLIYNDFLMGPRTPIYILYIFHTSVVPGF
jgi:hypothetical protein